MSHPVQHPHPGLRRRTFLAAWICALLVGALLITGPLAERASALAPSPTRSPAAPWAGEATRLSGTIKPAGRPVALQTYTSGAWKTVAKSKTGSRGAYAFTVTAGAKKGYRVKAPRVTLKGRTYSGVKTGTTYVTGVRPTPSIQFSPVAAYGSLTGGGLTPGAIVVTPARAGAKADLQKWTGTAWSTVVSGTTDASGLLPFRVDVGTTSSPRTFRAVVRLTSTSTAFAGAARAASFWKSAWHDEFDGTTLGSAWSHRDLGTRSGRRICSTTASRNTTVSGGAVHLKITKDLTNQVGTADCPYGTFRNAMVGTQHTKEFTYGVFAARMRVQAPRGMHSSFWLQSDGTPEIDTIEYFGDGRTDGGIAHFLHPHPSTGLSKVGGINARSASYFRGLGTTPSAGYHVYSVERTSGVYIFRINGVEVMRTSALRSTDRHYLVLSLLASDWEIAQMDQTRLSEATIDVDWVRVWTP